MDKAHIETDKLLEDMEKHIASIYNRAYKELSKKWVEYLKKAEKKADSLLKAVSTAKTPEEKAKAERQYKAYLRSVTLQNKRYKEMVEQTANRLLAVNETALQYINGQLPEVYVINHNGLAGVIEKDLVKEGVQGVSFTMVDENTVKKLATTNATLLPYKYINGKKDVRWNTKKINAEVLQGILQGESINTISKRLETVQDMNRVSAVRNARTMVTSAENSGRLAVFEEAEQRGLKFGKVWLATNDKRVRHAHSTLDGVMVENWREPFETVLWLSKTKRQPDSIMYPGDPSAHPANVYNCRCSLGYKYLGFKEVPVQNAMADKQVYEQKSQEWKNFPNNVVDRAAIIDKLLTEETGKKSVFNGKVVIDDSIKFNGTANYDGSITLRSKASIKTEIHELLHQHSEGGQNRVYVSIFKNIEEGSVELLAQEICHAKGIKIAQFDYSYTPYVDALRQINKLSGAYKTDYDFSKAVFEKPLEKRAEFLKSLGDRVAKDEKRFFRGALKILGAK